MRVFLTSLILSILLIQTASAQEFCAYVTNQGDDTVSLIDVSSNEVTATSTLSSGIGPSGIAYFDNPDAGAPVVVVANEFNNTVSLLAETNFTESPLNPPTDFNVGKSPFGVAVGPSDSFVYVANSEDNSITQIQIIASKNVATPVSITTTDVAMDSIPTVIASGNGLLYVSNFLADTVSVIGPNPNPPSGITVIDNVDVGVMPIGVAVTPNGDFVYVANFGSDTVSVIRTSDNSVAATVDVGNEPFGVAVNPSGDFVYVTNESSGTVSVIRTSDNTVAATVDVGESPKGIAVTPNGDFVYAANNGSDTVSVIRTSDNSVAATVDVGNEPVGIDIGDCIIGQSPPDTDADGVDDPTDADLDNDGITNNDEMSEDSTAAQSAVSLRNEAPNDPDGDGIVNFLDLDSDGDCIPDHFEAGGGNDGDRDGLSDNFVDIDMDGHHDEHDPDQTGNVLPLPDTDGDGTPDFLDPDSDNDGRSDAREAGGLDEDRDGIHDELLDLNLDGLADDCHPDTGVPLPILDLDSNGTPDFLEADANGGNSSCSLAAPGEAPSIPLYLLIPAFILISRLRRRQTK